MRMSRFLNHGAAITRSYAVLSSRGTTGTYQQQVLAFTVAGCKAPPRIFQGFLTAFGKARLVRRGRVHRWLARVSDETSSVSRLRGCMPLAPSVVCIATSASPADSCANITRNASLPLAVGGKLLY